MFDNKIFFLAICLFIITGCANAENKKELRVDKCSYEDEYFNYCKKKLLKNYNEYFENEPENFNKKYILKLIGDNDHSYHGIVAIEKKTGIVYTSIYNVKLDNNDLLQFNYYSNKFCLNGEVNSKSLSFNKRGKTCFLFSQGVFELDGKIVSKIQAKSDLLFINNKFMCGSKACKMKILTLNNLNEISKGQDSDLKFLVNERGFDTVYYDASDKENILYVFLYYEGVGVSKNLALAYMSNGILKFKSLGPVSSVIINGTSDIFVNGKLFNLD